MSTDDTTPTSSDATDQPVHSCCFCNGALERGSQHVSNNHSTVLYACPECKVGALATVEHAGPPSQRYAERLEHTQSDAMTGLSAYRVAAFITSDLPTGEYTVERVGEHQFRIGLPEAAGRLDQVRLIGRLSVGPLSAEGIDGDVHVRDTRWSHSDDSPVTDGGGVSTSAGKTGSRDDPFAVEPDDEPRTERAKTEDMDVSFAEKPGVYEVHSASDSYYDVDVLAETCSCPDRVERCKHLRRVELEITTERVPRPDGKLPGA